MDLNLLRSKVSLKKQKIKSSERELQSLGLIFENIIVGEHISSGAFGNIHKCIVNGHEVVIKILKDELVNEHK